MTLEIAGAWKAVEQSLTPAIKSLLVLTSIHENTHAITIYMSIQVKVMNLIQPTPWQGPKLTFLARSRLAPKFFQSGRQGQKVRSH